MRTASSAASTRTRTSSSGKPIRNGPNATSSNTVGEKSWLSGLNRQRHQYAAGDAGRSDTWGKYKHPSMARYYRRINGRNMVNWVGSTAVIVTFTVIVSVPPLPSET